MEGGPGLQAKKMMGSTWITLLNYLTGPKMPGMQTYSYQARSTLGHQFSPKCQSRTSSVLGLCRVGRPQTCYVNPLLCQQGLSKHVGFLKSIEFHRKPSSFPTMTRSSYHSMMNTWKTWITQRPFELIYSFPLTFPLNPDYKMVSVLWSQWTPQTCLVLDLNGTRVDEPSKKKTYDKQSLDISLYDNGLTLGYFNYWANTELIWPTEK